MVLVGLIAAVIGSAYVYVKNQHLAREDIKRTIQEDILKYRDDSDQLQSRIDTSLRTNEIYETLIRRKSTLTHKIPASAIITITPVEMPRADSYMGQTTLR